MTCDDCDDCDNWLTAGWTAKKYKKVCCSFRNRRTGIWHNFKLALAYSKICDQRHVHFVWPLLHWARSWTWQSFTNASQCLAHDFGGCTAIDAATCTMSENTLALGSLGASKPKHLNSHLPLHACGEQLEHGLTCNYRHRLITQHPDEMHAMSTNSGHGYRLQPHNCPLKPAPHPGRQANRGWVCGCRHVVRPDCCTGELNGHLDCVPAFSCWIGMDLGCTHCMFNLQHSNVQYSTTKHNKNPAFRYEISWNIQNNGTIGSRNMPQLPCNSQPPDPHRFSPVTSCHILSHPDTSQVPGQGAISSSGNVFSLEQMLRKNICSPAQRPNMAQWSFFMHCMDILWKTCWVIILHFQFSSKIWHQLALAW